MQYDFDYIIVGSGFGGAVSALRLTEKGYRVLVIEKGRRWKSEEFPESNWKLKKWLWLPLLNFRGIFKITIMRHVGILSGVGVGGGSLMYANTLPRPREAFFKSGSWSGLYDWKKELEPHYQEAERMLGAMENPGLYDADEALKAVADQFGKGDQFEASRVGVFFGEPEEEVSDPYFKGEGPRRKGCNFCGGCMTGCRYDAKNTLDKNYLYLAEKGGARIMEQRKVYRIRPLDGNRGESGYQVWVRNSEGVIRSRKILTSRAVVLSGGVLGTLRLLLNMKKKHLPLISDRLGKDIRTNNESLVLVHSSRKEKDFSRGVAIGSIFPADEDSHIEPVRYGSGSGFWKLLGVPLIHGKTMIGRTLKIAWSMISRPLPWFRSLFSANHAEESVILLFMQHLDSTLGLKRGWLNLQSRVNEGKAPSASIPLARDLAEATSRETGGHPFVIASEAILGTPLTAHILGGCVIGENEQEGVIDKQHSVFGYHGLYVCDGSAVSANPGVNPSLTITAMTEHAMCFIPEKK